MDFINKPMKWDNAGVQPSAELSAKGYIAKDKPAADTFNYFLHNFFKCIEEMQNSLKRIEIEDGGTGATNRKEAFYSLGCLGVEPIDSPDKDTPANWSALGTGYAWYGSNDRLKDQPTSYAIVLNLTYGSDITQFWLAQPIGRVYKRSGSSVGWDGTWFKSYDEKNKPTPSEIGASLEGFVSAYHSASTAEELDTVLTNTVNEMPERTSKVIGVGFSNQIANLGGGTWHIIINKTTNLYANVLLMSYDREVVKVFTRSLHEGTWQKFHRVYTEGNPPTPEDIGALPLAGGEITGSNLYIGNGHGRILANESLFQIEAWNEKGNDANRRILSLCNSSNESDKSRAILFTDRVNSINNVYKIYGEHNKPTASDVGLGVVDVSSKFGTTVTGATLSSKGVYKQGNVVSGFLELKEFTGQNVIIVCDEAVWAKHGSIGTAKALNDEFQIVEGGLCVIGKNGITLQKFDSSVATMYVSFTYICE